MSGGGRASVSGWLRIVLFGAATLIAGLAAFHFIPSGFHTLDWVTACIGGGLLVEAIG